MLVFARHCPVAAESTPDRPALLLEGHWPAEFAAPNRWSLDEAIDERHAWIDRKAAELAEDLGRFERGQSLAQPAVSTAVVPPTFACLNALALRYYLVRLLRVVAFFDQLSEGDARPAIEVHARRGDDEDYVDLLEQIAAVRGAALLTHWSDADEKRQPKSRRARAWRRWAAQADDFWHPATTGYGAARVVLCGNPHVLDPVCRALLDRGCQTWWLYEQFAVRSWWQWRGEGVRQLVCDHRIGRADRFNDGGAAGPLLVRGIDLGPSAERWLARQAAEVGGRQSRLLAQIDEHFRAVQPTALVLDEDATPLKRAAVMVARHYRARSAVVQHGSPCGPFGFTPLLADHFCAWGASSREQLLAWGAPADRIHETGWPRLDECLAKWQDAVSKRRTAAAPKILLLATLPPKDGRPDTAAFHLTRHSHDRMLDIAFATTAQLPKAKMTVKLHPRCRNAGPFERAAARYPQVDAEIVPDGDLARLVASSDCVLSCASTSGIEAALMGAPVVQLLPVGSGDVLPAERWGMLGSARDKQELEVLLAAALERGWQAAAHVDQVLGNPCRPAAEKVADLVLHGAALASAAAGDHGAEEPCR